MYVSNLIRLGFCVLLYYYSVQHILFFTYLQHYSRYIIYSFTAMSIIWFQTVTFLAKNSVHSFSPQLLEISFAISPSQRTVGEKMDAVLSRKFNWTDRISLSIFHHRCRRLTSVFEIISDRVSSIRWAFELQKRFEFIGQVGPDDALCKYGELGSNLERSDGRGWDIKVITLLFEQLEEG